MMLNPGQLTQGAGGQAWGGQPWGGQPWGGVGQPAGAGFGPGLSAYGGMGQAFGPQQLGQQYGQPYGLQTQAGLGGPAQATNAIEDIADDISERMADEIADQAATGAAALFQVQVPHAGGQSLGGLNLKRWLHATRITDTVHDPIKQNAHQLCRQVVGHLLNVLHAQWAGAGQPGGQQFGQQFGTAGQFGGLQAPGLAAYGVGQPFGQQNITQLAPAVAAILGMLQSQGLGVGQPPFGQAPFGQAQYGAPVRLI